MLRETTRSNMFIVQNGILRTPEEGVLHGITRKQLLKVAGEAYEVRTEGVSMADVFAADEVFMCSTTKGAMPIVQIDDSIIANGEPGPVTQDLMERFKVHVKNYFD